MNWTAVVPVKRGTARKSRLAKHLSPDERDQLSDKLVGHVLDALHAAPSITSICILSEAPHADERIGWHPDLGRGLNAELAAFAAEVGMRRLIVVLGDLPLVTSADIEALVEAAEQRGIAIAPDRHFLGTNALAIVNETAFGFSFGADSYRAHRENAGNRATIVARSGLSIDIDTPDDLAFAQAAGFIGRT
ncbi:MAG: 2-phospho-L-lactate guanylyltransferase [Sphingomonadales bacterium]|nr:2-phospho-L-lactate guanylyltransferase [Sphingomonadales bacterium]